MPKTAPILECTIQCPKCEKKTMRKSIGVKAIWPDMGGREYFCDQCHLYFGILELVEQWNYDLGDFMDISWVGLCSILAKEKRREKKFDYVAWWNESTSSPVDEPVWTNHYERNRDYETVTRMFLGVQEWEDDSVDTGALHV